MTRSALETIARLLHTAAQNVGLEGLLVILGTAALSVAAGYFHPAGPLIVTGTVLTTLGFAVALRAK
jgi:hypothetical protein